MKKLKSVTGWIIVMPQQNVIARNHIIHGSRESARAYLRKMKPTSLIKGKFVPFKAIKVKISHI